MKPGRNRSSHTVTVKVSMLSVMPSGSRHSLINRKRSLGTGRIPKVATFSSGTSKVLPTTAMVETLNWSGTETPLRILAETTSLPSKNSSRRSDKGDCFSRKRFERVSCTLRPLTRKSSRSHSTRCSKTFIWTVGARWRLAEVDVDRCGWAWLPSLRHRAVRTRTSLLYKNSLWVLMSAAWLSICAKVPSVDYGIRVRTE